MNLKHVYISTEQGTSLSVGNGKFRVFNRNGRVVDEGEVHSDDDVGIAVLNFLGRNSHPDEHFEWPETEGQA